MIDEFDYVQNIHSSAFFSYMATTRWFGVYLDWIVVIYLACCVLSFLLMPDGKYEADMCCCQVVWEIRILGIKIFHISINLFC